MKKKKKDLIPLADIMTRRRTRTKKQPRRILISGFDMDMDMDINVASSVPPPATTAKDNAIAKSTKKDLIPLLDRKGETYDPPALDDCSKMCVSLAEFKNFSMYIYNISHIHSPILICSDAESLEDLTVLIILHFPGDTNLDMLK